jgi:lipoprotein-anchoring transpeptidase ErfK/SrfK
MNKVKRSTAIAVAAATAVTALVVAGAYAYDSSRDDLVAHGVQVAGVDVGGMRESAAADKLEAELGPGIARPVVVAIAGRRFRLTAARSGVVPDARAMAAEAVASSRKSGLPARVWRGLTGGDVKAELPARVNYSEPAVRRFVREVARKVNRHVRDARLQLAVASLPVIPSRTGLRVNRPRLLRAVTSGLESLGAGRHVRVKVRVVRPKVTTRELAAKYPEFITIDRPAFTLRFFRRLKLSKTYTIAVGRVGLETPAGVYHIQNKQVNPSWHVPNSAWAGDLAGKVIPPGPDDPLKARWMGIYAGAGIHGTDAIGSLGSAASHGCIRMSIPDVEELYELVPISTPVYIQ